MEKFLLLAINSKYIHSNLAVYCLKAATEYSDRVCIKEYTINNHADDILKGIYEEQPDVIGISCYIWNIDYVMKLLPEIDKVMPDVSVWLGGPEVSYNAEYYINKYSNVAGVMCGEGELTFRALMDCYVKGNVSDISEIPGIACMKDGNIIVNKWPEPVNMDEIAMPYKVAGLDEEEYRNRIIYYESSRGCPFFCSYCLSSVDKKLRFKSLQKVFDDIQFFLDNRVPLVKFVDRTFNCKKEHARAIWKYIRDNDNGHTGFHFEISADILDDEDIDILKSMRPGLVQLEVGVQSVNRFTLNAIHRNMNLDVLKNNVKELIGNGNIHLHLDLIAGLPYEDMKSFKNSFDRIYSMCPHNLQLGFLKLLHGSLMRSEADRYGIVCRDYAPYEVLYTDCLTYGDVLELKKVENVLDMYYNSRMFVAGLKYLVGFYESAFDMYREFGTYYCNRYPDGSLPSRNNKYSLLYEFASGIMDNDELAVMADLLKYDMLLRDNVKTYPAFMEPSDKMREDARRYIEKGRTKAEHVEIFNLDVPHYIKTGDIIKKKTPVHFDYLTRTIMDNNASVRIMEELQ